MIFMNDHNSPDPEELKQLHAWAVAHCLPGMLCDECKTAFDTPFPWERFVKVDLAPGVFLMYVACEDCNERYEADPDKGFPNCYADAKRFKDRITVMPLSNLEVVLH